MYDIDDTTNYNDNYDNYNIVLNMMVHKIMHMATTMHNNSDPFNTNNPLVWLQFRKFLKAVLQDHNDVMN